MDFSAWNWATSFRLHEAACLIAGVMPISKRQPTTEELPSQARPILVKLMAAYVEWHLQKRNPDRPKSTFLEGYLNDDGALPEINSLAELPGALASREAINRFLLQIEGELGLKSAYDFGPICKTADPFSTDDQHPTQRTPTPDEPALDFNPQPDPAIATQHLVLDGFVPISGAINQGRAQVLEWLNAPREKLPQERQDAFALWCEIDAIDQQVRELETTQPVGVTEILARRAALKELHTERARLLAVLDDSEPPQLAPVEPCASTRPPRQKRPTWLDVAGGHILEVMRAGQHSTAKALFRALEERAGAGSPFDRGQGAHRGSLFAREIGQPLSLKTLQNHFSKLRAMVADTAP